MTLNSYEKLRDGRYLSPLTKVLTDDPVLKSFIKILYQNTENIYGSISFRVGIDDAVKEKIAEAFGDVYRPNPEGYVILLEDDITICAEQESSFVFAASDLWRMSDRDFLRQGIVYNRPLAAMRYLKLFTPAEWEIEDFKKIVDYCCYCRCNGIMIEVSGCMEYKRRPEINQKWVEYCSYMMEYSGRTEEIEHGYPWYKNSIHVENAQGKFLTQDTMRELVKYCSDRGIELIPEVPSLSHCDFLILPYPEIAERQEDPYPDTYCPSNPKSYEVLFDVLEEVIDVFHPKHINIGHDEYYSIGLCDRCKDRDAADIFADDVIKIHDFLAERGVRTMFWADKIIEIYSESGSAWGGAEYPIWDGGKVVGKVPATYRAIERMPEDVICINWSSGGGEQIDRKYLDRGFDMVYGNFAPMIMPRLKARFDAGAIGGGPSNWSASNLVYMQYNRVLFDLYYSSVLFWNDGYDEEKYSDTLEMCLKDMFRYSSAEKYARPHIEFTHATSYFRQFDYRHDGTTIDYERDTMGRYVVSYDDGTKLEVPLWYNQNITNKDRKWYRTFASPLFDVDFISYGTNYSHTKRFYDIDHLLMAAGYSTLPVRIGGDTYFRYVVENPYPDKKITGVTFEAAPGRENTVILHSVKFH